MHRRGHELDFLVGEIDLINAQEHQNRVQKDDERGPNELYSGEYILGRLDLVR